jgi:hypothetical protein
LDEALHLGGPDLDKPELGGDEQAVERHQKQRQDDHEGVEAYPFQRVRSVWLAAARKRTGAALLLVDVWPVSMR